MAQGQGGPSVGDPVSPTEQMGRILQRTAISTNIKERLDFSCALFGPDGGLVSNAPHIPVHLGAMQETVQFQVRGLGCCSPVGHGWLAARLFPRVEGGPRGPGPSAPASQPGVPNIVPMGSKGLGPPI